MSAARRRREPCHCLAYPFPHRPGGGDCKDPASAPACEDCEGSERVIDPYATGDTWYSEIWCTRDVCPYGKGDLP